MILVLGASIMYWSLQHKSGYTDLEKLSEDNATTPDNENEGDISITTIQEEDEEASSDTTPSPKCENEHGETQNKDVENSNPDADK